MEYLAKLVKQDDEKIFQTLYGHTLDALIALHNWISANENTLTQFCSQWKIEPVLFKQSVVWAVALHDMGKAIQPFQKNIRQGKHTSRYPHPFYSLPVMLAAYKNGLIKPLLPEYTSKVEYPLIEILSVMAHHSQLYNGLYSDTHADAVIGTTALKLIEKITDEFKKFGVRADGKIESIPDFKIRDLIASLFKCDVANVSTR